MNKLLWALQVVTALAFLGSGGMKLTSAPEKLRSNPQMGWSQEFSDGTIKAIGGAEVAGAAGLILPAATGILPILTPIAGTGLGLLMGGAAATHVRRGEPPFAPIVLGLFALTSGLLRWRRQRSSALVTQSA